MARGVDPVLVGVENLVAGVGLPVETVGDRGERVAGFDHVGAELHDLAEVEVVGAQRGADVGEGLLDLLAVVSESEWPLRMRLGQPDAGFGPEMRSAI